MDPITLRLYVYSYEINRISLIQNTLCRLPMIIPLYMALMKKNNYDNFSELNLYKRSLIAEFKLVKEDLMYINIMASKTMKALTTLVNDLELIKRQKRSELSYEDRIKLVLLEDEKREKDLIIRKTESGIAKSKCETPPSKCVSKRGSKRVRLISLFEERDALMFQKSANIVEVFLREEKIYKCTRKIERLLKPYSEPLNK